MLIYANDNKQRLGNNLPIQKNMIQRATPTTVETKIGKRKV